MTTMNLRLATIFHSESLEVSSRETANIDAGSSLWLRLTFISLPLSK